MLVTTKPTTAAGIPISVRVRTFRAVAAVKKPSLRAKDKIHAGKSRMKTQTKTIGRTANTIFVRSSMSTPFRYEASAPARQ